MKLLQFKIWDRTDCVALNPIHVATVREEIAFHRDSKVTSKRVAVVTMVDSTEWWLDIGYDEVIWTLQREE
jgi:hypothetical protein